MTILFVGLGNMGLPMATRLREAGNDVVAFDTSPAAAAAGSSAGVAFTNDLLTAAATADTVILMLPTSAIVEQVLHAGGLQSALPAGATIIDMGSSNPMDTRRLAQLAAERGLHYVDAPVSGGVAGAKDGKLTIMVGGPEEDAERVVELVQPLGSSIRRVGPIGAGHALKALNNLLSATHLLVSSEALLAGQEFGLDYDVMLEVLNTSSGRSGSTEVKWPKFVLPGTYDSGFAMGLMTKDMGIAVSLEESLGWDSPLSEFATRLWQQATEEMPPGTDHTAIVEWLRQRHEDRLRVGQSDDTIEE
jgi:3-hydroxyisobutyrate dehydrogenase